MRVRVITLAVIFCRYCRQALRQRHYAYFRRCRRILCQSAIRCQKQRQMVAHFFMKYRRAVKYLRYVCIFTDARLSTVIHGVTDDAASTGAQIRQPSCAHHALPRDIVKCYHTSREYRYNIIDCRAAASSFITRLCSQHLNIQGVNTQISCGSPHLRRAMARLHAARCCRLCAMRRRCAPTLTA